LFRTYFTWIKKFIRRLYTTENMSGLISALKKFFTKDRMIVLVLFIVLAVFMLYYSSGKSMIMDGMEGGASQSSDASDKASAGNVVAAAPASGPDGGYSSLSSDYSSHEVANPSELLPKDENSQWSSLNPSSQNAVNVPDMLQTGKLMGTVSQTRGNANLQLRSDPPIDKQNVGPWNQSSYEADTMRQPLEVG
jgi:hypothetical protein